MKNQTRPRRVLRRPRVEGLEPRQLLANFPVTTTAASGAGSLAAQIAAANTAGGANTITFQLTGTAPFTISPTAASPLPTISSALTIDGTSQSGYSGKPIIILDGASAGSSANGLNLDASGVVIKGLAIGNFSGSGIEIQGAGGDIIGASYLGTEDGTTAAPNGVDGVLISQSPNNTIGGSNANTNYISGNHNAGVAVNGALSKNNVVSYDVIGLDNTGGAAMGNATGVSEALASSTLIARDLISGNTNGGILLASGSGNVVASTLVGTNNAGAVAVGNGSYGIDVQGETGDQIGVAGFANINVISGNIGPGVIVNGATGTTIANNLIGLNKAGSAALGNAGDGVLIKSAAVNTTVGGSGAAMGNFISGNSGPSNTGNGVDVQSLSTGTLISFTHFGTDLSGLIGIPNSQNGIQFLQTSGTIQSNTIVDNGQSGVLLAGGSGSLVTSNYIGDIVSGKHGNAVNGVFIYGSSNNTIGGAGVGNVIGSNTNYGIIVEPDTKDSIASMGNSIAGNLVGIGVGGVARPNANGVAVFDAKNTTIGGASAGAGNFIGSNTGYGVDIDGTGSTGTTGPTGATGSLVIGNLIGLGSGGGLAPNSSGVILNGATGAVVQQNIVSGNTVDGVYVNGGSGSAIRLNLIGTDATGRAAAGNGGDGVDIVGATSVTVGGTTAATVNVISGNGGYGVQVSGAGAANETITGNYVGLANDGVTPMGNAQSGVWIDNVPGSYIGSTTSVYNIIANNGANGILITGSSATGTNIVGNFVGLGVDGETLGGNGMDGILVQGTPFVNISYNDVSGNANYGVHLASGANNAVIRGDELGTDAYGLRAKGNGVAGLLIDGTNNNIIGGTAGLGQRNLISGNKVGVFILGGTGNAIQGNYIGLNVIGNAALANSQDGLLVQGSGNTIGGAAAGAGNAISGNGYTGVYFSGGGSSNLVAGNMIGTDSTGGFAVPNAFYGVLVDGSTTTSAGQNTIGGTAAGAMNVISGSGVANINIYQALSNGTMVVGNRIGTNLAGTLGLFNTPNGILVNNSAGNTMGGTAAGSGNTISGSVSAGLEIINTGASANMVQGNLIGLAAGGSSTLKNAIGVIINNAPNNTVGGSVSGAANTITGNTTNGIQVTGSGATGNVTTGNNIGPD